LKKALPSKPDLTLVLDLSASLSLGLVDSGNHALSHRIKVQGTRGETAHALLEECLEEAGRDLGDIADICVGVGPGSFTGIRVCAAMAQGLAFAKRLPLFPFSSLAALLACASPDESASVRAIAAIAANAGRYFVRRAAPAGGSGGSGGGSLEALLSADETLALGSSDTVLITSGNFPDRERFLPVFKSLEDFAAAADFARIARMAHAGEPVRDGILRPNYLMASAAEEKRRADGAARSGDAPK
jgi:tRNA threonylcarbamoyladenosine biosynthesis protein TsaB